LFFVAAVLFVVTTGSDAQPQHHTTSVNRGVAIAAASIAGAPHASHGTSSANAAAPTHAVQPTAAHTPHVPPPVAATDMIVGLNNALVPVIKRPPVVVPPGNACVGAGSLVPLTSSVLTRVFRLHLAELEDTISRLQQFPVRTNEATSRFAYVTIHYEGTPNVGFFQSRGVGFFRLWN
jgi:hypothetical protein